VRENAKDVTGCNDWQPHYVYLRALIAVSCDENWHFNWLISIDSADGQSMAAGRFRLITRGDFDGVVCGALLRDHGLIDEIVFAHPNDMQHGRIQVSDRDITTNLPYVEGCHLAFDHHSSEVIRTGNAQDNFVNDPDSPSVARVVYNYYGAAEGFPSFSDELMDAVDRADSGQFTNDEVVFPTGWALLNFVVDARTGLGRWRDFRVTNEELLLRLVDVCRDPVQSILLRSDVSERTRLYFEHETYFKEQIQRTAEMQDKLVVLDLRQEDPIFAGNRFMVYALYPEANISMHCIRGLNNQNTVFAIGKSIFDRTSSTDVGELCLRYGGGGHHATGTCQVDNERAEEVKAELIAEITSDR